MATRIGLYRISPEVFKVNAAEGDNPAQERADLVALGRVLFYTHAQKGRNAMNRALSLPEEKELALSPLQYREANEKFRHRHLIYAAKLCAKFSGKQPPQNWEDFRSCAQGLYGDKQFYAVLQGIYQEVLQPILPAVYSESISMLAETVELGFAETYAVTIGSNDIPIFQDSSWGASRSVPRNRLYADTITLNPSPKSAWITAKYMQLIGTGLDFGAFFANIVAGMYSKTMAMFSEGLAAAVADTALVPAALSYTFNNANWMAGANKISALNRTPISNLIAVGNMVALSKVLPTQVTGSTNVNMDAAIATLLGADYTRSGYLGEFMAVRLLPMIDAIVPGTQNTTVQTVLSPNDVFMMAGNGLKPFVVAYNRDTPITLEMDPTRTADFEIGINVTMAVDSAAVFGSKVAHFTV